MCFHDGPGIRTVVFFKGCSIHCPWCSNPENISPGIECYDNDGKTGVFGKEITPLELYKELIKDMAYWEFRGGVTFSGGEAMLQADDLIEVIKLLKCDGINTIVESSLFIPCTKLNMVKAYIDGFIIDVKLLDKSECQEKLGGNIQVYLENVRRLHADNKILAFRFPLCRGYTFTVENVNLVIDFLKEYINIPVQLFSVHTLGESKYKALNRQMLSSVKVDKEDMDLILKSFVENGISAEIISI